MVIATMRKGEANLKKGVEVGIRTTTEMMADVGLDQITSSKETREIITRTKRSVVGVILVMDEGKIRNMKALEGWRVHGDVDSQGIDTTEWKDGTQVERDCRRVARSHYMIKCYPMMTLIVVIKEVTSLVNVLYVAAVVGVVIIDMSKVIQGLDVVLLLVNPHRSILPLCTLTHVINSFCCMSQISKLKW